MNTYIKYAVGLALGALAGFLYWKWIGCYSGSCPITSSPVNSTIYGGVMGVLTLNLFATSKSKGVR